VPRKDTSGTAQGESTLHLSIGKAASPQDGIFGRSPAVRDRSIKLPYLCVPNQNGRLARRRV
jgi:hypothetical protein